MVGTKSSVPTLSIRAVRACAVARIVGLSLDVPNGRRLVSVCEGRSAASSRVFRSRNSPQFSSERCRMLVVVVV